MYMLELQFIHWIRIIHLILTHVIICYIKLTYWTKYSYQVLQSKFLFLTRLFFTLFHSVPDNLPFSFSYILWLYYIPGVQYRLHRNCFSQSATLHNISICFCLSILFALMSFLQANISFLARHKIPLNLTLLIFLWYVKLVSAGQKYSSNNSQRNFRQLMLYVSTRLSLFFIA